MQRRQFPQIKSTAGTSPLRGLFKQAGSSLEPSCSAEGKGLGGSPLEEAHPPRNCIWAPKRLPGGRGSPGHIMSHLKAEGWHPGPLPALFLHLSGDKASSNPLMLGSVLCGQMWERAEKDISFCPTAQKDRSLGSSQHLGREV